MKRDANRRHYPANAQSVQSITLRGGLRQTPRGPRPAPGHWLPALHSARGALLLALQAGYCDNLQRRVLLNLFQTDVANIFTFHQVNDVLRHIFRMVADALDGFSDK